MASFLRSTKSTAPSTSKSSSDMSHLPTKSNSTSQNTRKGTQNAPPDLFSPSNPSALPPATPPLYLQPRLLTTDWSSTECFTEPRAQASGFPPPANLMSRLFDSLIPPKADTIVPSGVPYMTRFTAFTLFLIATALHAQVQPPPAPWRGAGPTPCVGFDGGIFQCPPAPRVIAIRAGRLFDSKTGQLL